MNTAIRNSMSPAQLAASSGDPREARWSNMESLTAALIDELRQFAWMYASSHSENMVPKPERVPRPGIAGRPGRGKVMSIENARAIDPRLRDVPDEHVQSVLDRITGRQ